MVYTEISLQNHSTYFYISPDTTIMLERLTSVQSDKIRVSQNIIKLRWYGDHFDWKVSVEISMKSDLMKLWHKNHVKKRRALVRKVSHQQQARVFTFRFFGSPDHMREWI